MITAQVILASQSVNYSKPLVTFKLRYPRFIHAEFMTHRMLSRNASSSRAVPFEKLVQQVRDFDKRAAPVFWGAEQKGMQTGEELSDERPYDETKKALMWSPKRNAQETWGYAAHAAAEYAEKLAKLGVHKSICNRIIEPFTHINVVATATEWDNFFGLRLHKDAEPTMRALAEAMWRKYNSCPIWPLDLGDWHMPFIVDDDFDDYDDCDKQTRDMILLKVSVARCARVSYESNVTGKRSTIEEDLALYDRLVGAQPLHASPAEHQATPDEFNKERAPYTRAFGWQHPKQHGNFVGWRQYRKMLPEEAIAPLPTEYQKESK